MKSTPVIQARALALCKSVDLASGGRECRPDRDVGVRVTAVIGGLVTDHDVLVWWNRQPYIDAVDAAIAVLRTGRDNRNATSGDVALRFLQPFHFVFDYGAGGV